MVGIFYITYMDDSFAHDPEPVTPCCGHASVAVALRATASPLAFKPLITVLKEINVLFKLECY